MQVTPETPECTGAAGVIYWQVRCAQLVFLSRLAHFYVIGARNAIVSLVLRLIITVPTLMCYLAVNLIMRSKLMSGP